MKELSIEEKAKAYDEALKKAKDMLSYKEIRQEDVEYLFPELKESEDERIRKELICYFEKYPSIVIGPFNTKECIAWLEKQPTPQVRTGLEWVNTIDGACDKRYSEEYAHGEYCHEQSFKWGFQEGVDWFEKQGEQKPYGQREECLDCQMNYAGECKGSCVMKRDEQKPADKVEPRFKVGDWITNGIDVYKIKNIDLNEFNYIFENGISDISLVDNICHLWTIQDAKDGDVLVDEDDRPFIFFKGFLYSRNPQFPFTFIKWSYWSFRY